MFVDAIPVRPQSVAIIGPSGAGKTRTALHLALAHDRILGGGIGLIDCGERGGSGGYSDIVPHAVAHVPAGDFGVSVKGCLDALSIAGRNYGIVVIDSLSELWLSVLAYKESLDARGGNSFANWGKAGKLWESILRAVWESPIPVICTVRSKMSYAQEYDESARRQVVRKLGLRPIWRDGSEYRFDLLCSMQDRMLQVDQPRHIYKLSDLMLQDPTTEQLVIFWE